MSARICIAKSLCTNSRKFMSFRWYSRVVNSPRVFMIPTYFDSLLYFFHSRGLFGIERRGPRKEKNNLDSFAIDGIFTQGNL